MDENVGLTCYVLLLLMFEKIMDPVSEWKPACLETTINFANLPYECIKLYVKLWKWLLILCLYIK